MPKPNTSVALVLAFVGLRAHEVAAQRAPLQQPRLPDYPRAVDTDQLLRIEDRVLPPVLVPGPAAHRTLPEFYWAANRPLRARLDRAREAYDSPPTRPFRSVTLIAGDAGVGKTFIKGEVVGKDIPREHLFKCDLRELYEQWQESGQVELRNDLSADQLVINSLPAIRAKSRPLLKERLSAESARFFIIDSLDEVHPDDYVPSLMEIVDFAFHGDRPFVHVVVLGRPFSFHEFWQQYQAKFEQYDLELHMLNAPQLRTTGDLLLSSWNYHTWKFGLKLPTANGEQAPMSLEQYIRWTELGFAQTGPFASITFDKNEDMNRPAQNTMHDVARRHRMVQPVLQNLAGNSLLREILCQRATKGLDYDEREVATAYLHGWLDRENETDDRPCPSHPEYLDLYLQLLRGVALKSLVAGQLDEQGYFEVSEQDMVRVDYRERTYTFPVRRIVVHSGLTHMDPRLPGVAKYRFNPIWLHRWLVEQHNSQLAAGQELMTVEHVAR